MKRLPVLAFLLAPLVLAASPAPPAAHTLRISFYAPVQKDSPLHIIGLQYDEHGVQLRLSSPSNLKIVGALIEAVGVAPAGCSVGPEWPEEGVNNPSYFYDLHLEAHSAVETFQNGPFGFGALAEGARHLRAAYLQYQAGVVEVDFADGTKWSPHHGLTRTQLDPALLDSEAGSCPDAAAVIEALGTMNHIDVDGGLKKASYPDESDGSEPPRLHYSCRPEDTKVVCPSH
jgi:hypothetical protein